MLSFSLTDSFIEQYRNKEVNWGYPLGKGNSLGEITYITKYSRRKDDGSKEQWYETCRRCIEGMYSILKDHCKDHRTPWNAIKANKSAQEAYDRMFNFKWTPPGRGLWMMGTPFVHEQKNSAALQNCFSGEEKFLTKELGVVSFADVVDQQLTVVGQNNQWRKADIQAFGKQSLQLITLAPARDNGAKYRSNHRVVIKVTPNHRWILKDGSITTDLQVGNLLPSSVARIEFDENYWEGVAHGLIFGDGVKITHRYANGDYGFELRACDKRTQSWLEEKSELRRHFDKINYDRKSAKGDPICFKRSSTDMKQFPDQQVSASYIQGFLKGWMIADSSLSNDVYKLASQNPTAHSWLQKNAALAGYILVGANIDSVMETNFGLRKQPCWRFSLRASTTWKVESILPLDEEEEVFCAVVPDEGAFTLASGVYTGNCAFVSTGFISSRSVEEAVLPFERMMEMSMLGIGVGFDVNGAGKLTLHQPGDNKGITVYQIPDTREGWCKSVALQLESFFFEGRPPVRFDYSLIRPAGAPIKGFGGIAAGSGVLEDLHIRLNKILSHREGDKITSTDITDIMNLIGKCVVAGNVRRSAQIAFGDPTDEEYINLKNWEANPERMGANGWGNLSNNSIFASIGGNYDSILPNVIQNGEPGFFYRDLAREYGRLVDPPNGKDYRVAGGNPCLEQSLEHMELCTLVETYLPNHDSYEDFERTLKFAYLYGKAVTLLPTHWAEANEVMQRNRRIGCSMSGVAQFVESKGWIELRNWMNNGYNEIQRRDTRYSEWLGIRESIKTTSIKPSGTVSLLAGVTPGVHWPVASTYIRRMRLAVNDPILGKLQSAGYKVDPDIMDPDHTMVVELPTKGPQVRSEREVSVWEKAQLAIIAQRYWADNQVSVTFTFKPEESELIAPMIYATEGQLKGFSLLPIGEEAAYEQMPYEKIPDGLYESMVKKVQPIDFKGLYQGEALDPTGERFCTTDKCEIF